MGQIMGTSVGTQVFVKFGWRPAAALSVAWTGFTLVVMLVRGPQCSRYTWFGYEGGCDVRKRPVGDSEKQIESGSAESQSVQCENTEEKVDVQEYH